MSPLTVLTLVVACGWLPGWLTGLTWAALRRDRRLRHTPPPVLLATRRQVGR